MFKRAIESKIGALPRQRNLLFLLLSAKPGLGSEKRRSTTGFVVARVATALRVLASGLRPPPTLTVETIYTHEDRRIGVASARAMNASGEELLALIEHDLNSEAVATLYRFRWRGQSGEAFCDMVELSPSVGGAKDLVATVGVVTGRHTTEGGKRLSFWGRDYSSVSAICLLGGSARWTEVSYRLLCLQADLLRLVAAETVKTSALRSGSSIEELSSSTPEDGDLLRTSVRSISRSSPRCLPVYVAEPPSHLSVSRRSFDVRQSESPCKELRELRRYTKLLRRDNKELRAENTTLRAQLANRKRSRRTADLAEESDGCEKLRAEKEIALKRLSLAEAENESLRRRTADCTLAPEGKKEVLLPSKRQAEDELQATTQELAADMQVIQKLNGTICVQRAQIESLRAQLADRERAYVESKHQMELRLQSAEHHLAMKDSQVGALQSQCNSLSEAFSGLQQKMIEEKFATQSLKAELGQLQVERQKAKREAEELEKHLESFMSSETRCPSFAERQAPISAYKEQLEKQEQFLLRWRDETF